MIYFLNRLKIFSFCLLKRKKKKEHQAFWDSAFTLYSFRLSFPQKKLVKELFNFSEKLNLFIFKSQMPTNVSLNVEELTAVCTIFKHSMKPQ